MGAFNTSDFLKQVEEQRSNERALAWEGTFGDYLDLVAKQPKIADRTSTEETQTESGRQVVVTWA